MTSSGSSSSRATLGLLTAVALACPGALAAAQAEPTPTQGEPSAPRAEPSPPQAEPSAPEAGPTTTAGPTPPATEPATPAAPPAGWSTFQAERDVTPSPPGAPNAERGPRLALFPIQNLSAGHAPVRELTAALRAELIRRGVALAAEEEVRRVLVERRIRSTSGLDRATAAALRTGLGVDGVVIASLGSWLPAAPYRVALSARLVSTEAEPAIQWTEQLARTGDDAPGLLGLGVMGSVERLGAQVLEQAAASLASALRQPARPGHRDPCPHLGATAPRRHFRSPTLLEPDRRSIAVLPFLDSSGRRDAGELVMLRFVGALAASDTIRLVEPGVVRAEMLSHRLGATGPPSLDDARVILELVNADLVLSGTVRTFEEAAGHSGAPAVEFSTWVLDRATQRVVWSSVSSAAGDDGVVFFGLGRTSTADGLSCRLARGVVGVLLQGRPPIAAGAPVGADAGERTPAP